VIVGAPSYNSNNGAVYIIFGAVESQTTPLSMAALTSAEGISIYGPDDGGFCGSSVSSGDFDGDGIKDILLGTR